MKINARFVLAKQDSGASTRNLTIEVFGIFQVVVVVEPDYAHRP
jgi:hypothetical protein